jgi:hypothetical protein
MIARLDYRASARLTNVVFKISIYWPSGYLCSELATDSPDCPLEIGPGLGAVEFCCSAAPFQPGMYRVDVSIESNGSVLDQRPRCATLRVDPGKAMLGDFFFNHTWQIVG